MSSLRDFNELVRYKLGLAKYFFVHIPKTGGVAIKRHSPLLNQIISARPFFYRDQHHVFELRRQMRLVGECHGLAHARLIDINPKIIQSCKPFAIVRNPWSRTVSRWKFGLLAIKQGSQPPDYVPDTFREFLSTRDAYQGRPYYWHRATHGWYQQWNYICDDNGNMVCDLLRFETISDDVNRYFGLHRHPLKQRNKNALNCSDYREYYTAADMIDCVASWYNEDINRLGFDFDSPARKALASAIDDGSC
jgi:hypothetical protein